MKRHAYMHKTYLSIIETCIPRHTDYSFKETMTFSWLNKSFIQAMIRRNALFKRVNQFKNLLLLLKYKNNQTVLSDNSFSCSITRCGCPQSLSSVLPIPKKPGAKQPADFRPISLLPIISSLVYHAFLFFFFDCQPHCNNNCPLSNNRRWGLQHGKSTVSALVECTHDWFSS